MDLGAASWRVRAIEGGTAARKLNSIPMTLLRTATVLGRFQHAAEILATLGLAKNCLHARLVWLGSGAKATKLSAY
jgi:hypothetical protein